MILLDTDHLTVLKYPDNPRYAALTGRLEASTDQEIGTTIISVEEQWRGWLAVISRVRQVVGLMQRRDGRTEKLGVASRLVQREESDLDTFFESRGNASEHSQGMAFIVRILKPADHRGSGSDAFCQLSLR